MSQHKQTLIPIARQIAQHLGTDWAALDRHENPYRRILLHGPEDQILSLKIRNGRITVSGLYPHASDGGPTLRWSQIDRPVITVAATSTPETVARHIQRRFLPRYRQALSQIQKEVREYEEYHNLQRQALIALSLAAGLPLPPEGQNHFYWYTTHTVAKIRVNSTTARLELQHVPLGLAVRIIEMVRDFAAESEVAP